jgi:ADP-ribose pyrophosphatase YjhB (NUDIX family)
MPGLPKGHQDEGEDDLATARRETEEETGLTDLEVDPWFRSEIAYRVRKDGQHRRKTVVYFRARLRSGTVRLSHEHTAFDWAPLPETLRRITFDSLREVVREAALHAKDPGLFRLRPATEAEADRHLAVLPRADEALLGHLRGAARIARTLAAALEGRGLPVRPEAAAAGTLLHDVGRAVGRHEDHQLAGIHHLRTTSLAPYAFACVSHTTKGATARELREAGVSDVVLDQFRRAIEIEDLTWEEKCAALADSCMRGPTPVPPAERFRDLRERYGTGRLIDLQERRTEAPREEMAGALGRDPLALAGLA